MRRSIAALVSRVRLSGRADRQFLEAGQTGLAAGRSGSGRGTCPPGLNPPLCPRSGRHARRRAGYAIRVMFRAPAPAPARPRYANPPSGTNLVDASPQKEYQRNNPRTVGLASPSGGSPSGGKTAAKVGIWIAAAVVTAGICVGSALTGCLAAGAGASLLAHDLTSRIDGTTPSGTDRALAAGAGAVGGGVGRGGAAAGARVAAAGSGRSSRIVREAAAGRGNFGVGSATSAQANRAGVNWVGQGHRVASDGRTLVSKDGLRQWRPPTHKPKRGSWQSNFESRDYPKGPWLNNGHLDITDQP